MFRRWLTRLSPEPLDYQIVEIGFPEMPNALKKNSIDVAAVVEPFIEPPLHSDGFRLLSRHYLDVSDNVLVATYVASSRWAREHPQTLVKFQTAMARATQFIQDNQPQARDIIGTYTRISEPDLFMIGLPAFEDAVNVEDLERVAVAMQKVGLLKDEVDVRPMVTK